MILTVTRLPLSDFRGTKVAAVAPLTALPETSHWYVNKVPEVHLPGLAVRVTPILGVPEIDGFFVYSFLSGRTLAVVAEVLVTEL